MKKYLVALVLLLATSAAAAAAVPPHAVVRAVTDEVLAIVRAGEEGQLSPGEIMQRVEAAVRPHFSFTRMTQVAMERHWHSATAEQQKALTEEFRTLLLRVYAVGITLYGDHKIDYSTVPTAGSDTDAVVKSLIMQAAGEPVTIEYKMEKIAGAWRAYDLKINGISMVENYRATFDTEIQKSGVAGLIEALSQKNDSLVAHSSR